MDTARLGRGWGASAAGGSLALLCALAPGQAIASEPDAHDPIIGGVPTSGRELDAVVSIRSNSQLCTGSLISPTVILTAAHCLEETPPSSTLTVFFGDDESTAESMIATGFGLHPQYCDLCASEKYDFAYVTLPEAYSPSDGLLLPIVDQREWDEAMRLGNVVLLAGFGTTDPQGGSVGNAVKHKVTTTISDFTSLGNEFFAGGGQRDTCSGDSGGPAIAVLGSGAMRLAGVTSRGSVPCGNGGWYGVPFSALQWLETETGAELLPLGCELGGCLETTPAGEDEGRCAVGRPGSSAPLLLLALLGLRARRRREASLEAR